MAADHYRVEARLVDGSRPTASDDAIALPSLVVANHVLAVIAVHHAISLPGGNAGDTFINLTVRPDPNGQLNDRFQVSFVRSDVYLNSHSSKPLFGVQRLSTSVASTDPSSTAYRRFKLPASGTMPNTYDTDGRVLASIADANARQLLFVKITRG
jgi:hypothetical protein